MSNLNYSIKRTGASGKTVTIGIKAAIDSIAEEVKKVLVQAAQEGERVARAEAPRSGNLSRKNAGRTIVDSIRSSTEAGYRPGGAGGGGQRVAEFYADGDIAPHLRYVFDGTMDGGSGRIYPAKGNVFAIEKEGEGVRFREWIHGQKPQQEWWQHAQEAAEAATEKGLRDISDAQAFRNSLSE